jgi:anti-sigma regulatory factor (Ser/Thr protein kinase)
MESLTVPGNLDSLGPLRDCVRSAAGSAGLGESAVYGLILAVDEVATNIVMHGYDEAGRAGMIRMWCEMDADVLKIYMEDTGAPYDPGQLRVVDIDQPLENRKQGGLGVFLAMRGVDDLEYANGAGGTNRHTFVVRRHAGARTETRTTP